MPTHNYDETIPASDHNPSNDQPIMQTNAASIKSIVNEDHYTFNTSSNDGWHRQITLPAKNLPAGAPTDPKSFLYTASGTALTNAQAIFWNQSAKYMLSAVRAFGVFPYTPGTGAVSITNSYNITSVTVASALTYTVNITANAISSTQPAVFIMVSDGTGVDWGYSANVLTFTLDGIAVGEYISVLMLQA